MTLALVSGKIATIGGGLVSPGGGGGGTIFLQEDYNGYPTGNITSITSALSTKGYTDVTFANTGDLSILGRASMPAGLLADSNFPSGKTQLALFTLPAVEDETRLVWAGFPNTTTRDVSWSWWEYRPNANTAAEKFHRAGNWVNGTIGGTRALDYIIGYGNPVGTVTLFSQGNDATWPDQVWGTFTWPSGLHHFERVDHLPTDTSSTYTCAFYIDGNLQGSASGLPAYLTSGQAAFGWMLWDFGGWGSAGAGPDTFPISRYMCAARIASQYQGVWAMNAV